MFSERFDARKPAKLSYQIAVSFKAVRPTHRGLRRYCFHSCVKFQISGQL